MYHTQTYAHIHSTTLPVLISSFMANAGLGLNGTDVQSWGDQEGSGTVVAYNSPNENPSRHGTIGGMSPAINFVQTDAVPERMFGTTLANDWDDNGAGRGEGTLVMYLNHNTANNAECIIGGISGDNVRRMSIRPSTTSGFQIASTVNNAGSYENFRCASMPQNTATVVVITVALDGTKAIYFDGVSQTITNDTYPAGRFIPNMSTFSIGTSITSTAPTFPANQQFDGQVSAIQLYDTPMTAAQAQAITTSLQATF